MELIRELLDRGEEILSDRGIENPRRTAEELLCFILRIERVKLYLHNGEGPFPDSSQSKAYLDLVRLRAGGTPLQLLTGFVDFYNCRLRMRPGVFIPRPETETLVDLALESMKERTGRMLDLCTGTGAVAVAFGAARPDFSVVAADVSRIALSLAAENACINSVESLKVVQSNLLEPFKNSSFDCITANPPYIKTGDIPGLQVEVKDFDPLNALDGGPDGLEFFRRLAREAPPVLAAGGVLAVEVGDHQATDVHKIMTDVFEIVTAHKDLTGMDRVVACLSHR